MRLPKGAPPRRRRRPYQIALYCLRLILPHHALATLSPGLFFLWIPWLRRSPSPWARVRSREPERTTSNRQECATHYPRPSLQSRRQSQTCPIRACQSLRGESNEKTGWRRRKRKNDSRAIAPKSKHAWQASGKPNRSSSVNANNIAIRPWPTR